MSGNRVSEGIWSRYHRRKLDTVTFHHPEVVRQAERHFTLIKVDVTRGGHPVHDLLLQQYNVKGVPTIVFLDAQGNERTDLRVVDFIPPDQFLVTVYTYLPIAASWHLPYNKIDAASGGDTPNRISSS